MDAEISMKVLLVEDNKADAVLLQNELALLSSHVKVAHVQRLSDATKLLGQMQYDAVLLDLSLPDSSGLKTLDHAHAVAPHDAIIVLTGLDDEALALEAVRRGAQDYLVKGQVNSRLLMRALNYAVERKRLEEQRERLLEELQAARSQLEIRVRERTKELADALETLQGEVRERIQLEHEVLEISEKERRRVGRDLHDSLGQLLTGISMLNKVVERKLAEMNLPQAQAAREVSDLLNQAIAQTRLLSRGLNPVEPKAEGLMTALQELADNCEKFSGMECTFSSNKPVFMENDYAARHLYHIAQEALNNAVRHSQASVVNIRLDEIDSELRLTVADDGVGLKKEVDGSRSMGMRTMRYRASIIDGRLEIGPQADGGTIVTCAIPIGPKKN